MYNFLIYNSAFISGTRSPASCLWKSLRKSQNERSEDDWLESVNTTNKFLCCQMNETGRLQNYQTIIGPTINNTWHSNFMWEHFQPHWMRQAWAPLVKQILVVSSVSPFFFFFLFAFWLIWNAFTPLWMNSVWISSYSKDVKEVGVSEMSIDKSANFVQSVSVRGAKWWYRVKEKIKQQHTPEYVGNVCFCKTTDMLHLDVSSGSIWCLHDAVLYALVRFRYRQTLLLWLPHTAGGRPQVNLKTA